MQEGVNLTPFQKVVAQRILEKLAGSPDSSLDPEFLKLTTAQKMDKILYHSQGCCKMSGPHLCKLSGKIEG